MVNLSRAATDAHVMACGRRGVEPWFGSNSLVPRLAGMRRMTELKSRRWRHGDELRQRLMGPLGVIGNRGVSLVCPLLFTFVQSLLLFVPYCCSTQ